jgi:hypothetical protein
MKWALRRYAHCMQLVLHRRATVPAGNHRLRTREEIVTPTRPTDGDDAAAAALATLLTELDRCIAQLEHARDRAARLLQERRAGRPWLDVVTQESRPLVVESISSVLSALATAGHAWRRDQALALQSEDVSINRIAAMFGVTRQRISALLREAHRDGAASS